MRIDVDNLEPRNFDRGAVRVIKNFLPKPLFKELQEVVMGDKFPWVFVPYTVKENLYDKKTGEVIESRDDGNFMFVHMFVLNSEVTSSRYEKFSQMLPYVKEALDYKKLNLLDAYLLYNNIKYYYSNVCNSNFIGNILC